MTVAAIIQARTGSTRLPGKVLQPLGDRTVLEWVIRAAQEAHLVDSVIVATTTEAADDPIVALCDEQNVAVHRGSENDVLQRYIETVDRFPADTVVRLTSDCPLLDPALIDMTIAALRSDLDYVSTGLLPHLPVGLSVEVFSTAALRAAGKDAKGADRIHVTSFIYRNPYLFRIEPFRLDHDAAHYRVTVDTEADYQALVAIVAELGDEPPAVDRLVEFLNGRPDIVAINDHIRQKEIDEG